LNVFFESFCTKYATKQKQDRRVANKNKIGKEAAGHGRCSYLSYIQVM